MSIEVHITKNVKKDLDKLASEQDKEETIKLLKELKGNPELGYPLKGKLKGYYSLHFSLSSGAARAIYKILKKENLVLVILVAYRENIYDLAKRRIK